MVRIFFYLQISKIFLMVDIKTDKVFLAKLVNVKFVIQNFYHLISI